MRLGLEKKKTEEQEALKSKQKAKSAELIDAQVEKSKETVKNKTKNLADERAAMLDAEKARRQTEQANKNKKKNGKSVASTSWVVHGSHSASGMPLVVVEPHISPDELTQYSVSQLEISGQSLVGSTFLGVPGLVNGRTERAAWGQTSAMQLNNVNLYLEVLNEAETHYLIESDWVPL